MEFKIKRTSGGSFTSVDVNDGGTTIDLGYLDDDEARELAMTLVGAAYDLGPALYDCPEWFAGILAECDIEIPAKD